MFVVSNVNVCDYVLCARMFVNYVSLCYVCVIFVGSYVFVLPMNVCGSVFRA